MKKILFSLILSGVLMVGCTDFLDTAPYNEIATGNMWENESLAQQGIGVIIISDDLPEILDNCNRALIMKKGRLAGEVQTDEITSAELADILAAEAGKEEKAG